MNKLKNLAKEMKALEEKLQNDGQQALKEAFEEFFNAHPMAKSILWAQYTPYWQDGDACTFGLNDFELKTNVSLLRPEVKEWWDPDAGEDGEDEYHYGSGDFASLLDEKKLKPTAEEKAMCKDFNALVDACNSIPRILELVFEDHALVRADRTGFTVTEFEHD